MTTTSSFSEDSSVFGGQANLLGAFTNIFTLYNPDIIAVNTTCLSEVIGDDLVQIIKKDYEEKKIPPDLILIL
jgi:nitrogenase molybdenum-iron protein beta chain